MTDDRRRSEDPRVRAELAASVAGNLVNGAVGQIGGSVTVLALLAQLGPLPRTAWVWAAVTVAIGVAVGGLVVLHRRWPTPRWERISVIAFVVSALCWPCALLVRPGGADPFLHALVVVFAVVATTSAQSVAYAGSLVAGRAVLVGQWGLMAALLTTERQWALVAGCVVMASFLLEQHRRLHLTLVDAVANRFDAEDLRTEVAEQAEAAVRTARSDGLTSLLNRVGLQEVLEATDAEQAVLFVDLDHFKAVNDSLGHGAGDEVLRVVAERLVSLDGVGVARFGGDEFVLLVRPPPRPLALRHLAERVLALIEEPISVPGHRLGGAAPPTEVSVSGSVGVAVGRGAEVLEWADQAMYRAKEDGRARIAHSDAAMRAELAEATRLRADLREALDAADPIEVWGQAIVGLPSGRPVGVELLSRWNRGEAGLVRPDLWIPVVEEIGGMGALGRRVLDRAGWMLSVTSDVEAWVNIGAQHLLGAGFVDDVLSAMERHGADPGRLVVEVTETVFLSDRPVAQRTVAELREHGIGVALDDFGTGYSSLSYLTDLSVSAVKLDRGFVTAVDQDRRRRTILGAIVDLGRGLDVTIVAEGVERPEERTVLAELGVPRSQGFLFGRPTQLDRVVRTLDGSSVRASEPG